MPYRVGWMQDNEWGNEGNFQWQEVPLNAELAFGSLRGRSGYTTPFAVAHNNVYGGYLAGQPGLVRQLAHELSLRLCPR